MRLTYPLTPRHVVGRGDDGVWLIRDDGAERQLTPQLHRNLLLLRHSPDVLFTLCENLLR